MALCHIFFKTIFQAKKFGILKNYDYKKVSKKLKNIAQHNCRILGTFSTLKNRSFRQDCQILKLNCKYKHCEIKINKQCQRIKQLRGQRLGVFKQTTFLRQYLFVNFGRNQQQVYCPFSFLKHLLQLGFSGQVAKIVSCNFLRNKQQNVKLSLN